MITAGILSGGFVAGKLDVRDFTADDPRITLSAFSLVGSELGTLQRTLFSLFEDTSGYFTSIHSHAFFIALFLVQRPTLNWSRSTPKKYSTYDILYECEVLKRLMSVERTPSSKRSTRAQTSSLRFTHYKRLSPIEELVKLAHWYKRLKILMCFDFNAYHKGVSSSVTIRIKK